MGLLRCPVHGLSGFELACGHVLSAQREGLPSGPLELCSLRLAFSDKESYTLAVFAFCDECARRTGIAGAPATVEDIEPLCEAGSDISTPLCVRCAHAWRESRCIPVTRHDVVER